MFDSRADFRVFINAFAHCVQNLASASTSYRAIKPAGFIIHQDGPRFEPGDTSTDFLCMAPEETGLLQDIPDKRAGFYRLGIVLYRLVTSFYPFESFNPSELLYAHIARKHLPAHRHNPHVPDNLSLVIDKLLEKRPADRYQSYAGLLTDLRLLADNPDEAGFAPGRKDVAEEILFSGALYGRTGALQSLLASLAGSATGTRVIGVTGEPGIGKTTIIQQALAYATGIVATGKFEKLKQAIPYSAFSVALYLLGRKIMARGKDEAREFSAQLLTRCPHEAPYLSLLSGELESLTGRPDKELPASMMKPVLETALKAFLQVLSAQSRLILFFDDLQWADTASIDLLTFIAGDKDSNCTLILSYREHELPELFHRQLETVTGSSLSVSLQKLGAGELTDWIRDLTGMAEVDCRKLAAFMEKRTFGNPFYFRQLIKLLERQGFLYYDKGRWHIDFSSGEFVGIPADAAQWLLHQVKNLPAEEQAVLSAASVFGQRFTAEQLRRLLPEASVEQALQVGESRGFLLPVSEDEDIQPGYRFAHDTLKSLFYELLPEVWKESLHRSAGALLQESGASVFDVAGQYNRALSFFCSPEQKALLAALNLEAGILAGRSAAAEAALHYLNLAESLLADRPIRAADELRIQVAIEKAEAAYLNSLYIEAEERCRQLIDCQPSAVTELRARELMLLSFIAQGKMEEAVSYTIETLATLGVDLPRKADHAEVGRRFEAIGRITAGRSTEELLELPVMRDPEKKAAMRFLMHGGSAAYFVAQDIYPLIALKQMELSLTYGNCPDSADAYTTYGLLLSAFAGDIPGGYAFGKLGVAIREKFNAFELEAKTANIFNGFVQHVKEPLRATIPPLRRGYIAGLETGDIEYACYVMTFLFLHQVFASDNFYEAAAEQVTWLQTMEKLKNDQTLEMALPWHHLLLQLSSHDFDVSEADAYAIRLDSGDNPIARAYACIARLTAAVYFGDTGQALLYGQKSAAMLEHVAGIHVVPVRSFYYGLALAETSPEDPALDELMADLEHRAIFAPENYRHKFLLLQAVRQAVRGDEEVRRLFSGALEAAAGSGILIEAGLAFEKYADYLHTRGDITEAMGALLQSIRCYGSCHADKKQYLLARRLKSLSGLGDTDLGLGAGDFVYKEIHKTLLGQLSLPELVRKLLAVALKSTGADRAVLIINREEPYIAGEVGDQAYVEVTMPLNRYEAVPRLFVQEALLGAGVQRWQENESAAPAYESYFAARDIVAAIAQPLLTDSGVIGALYLESGRSNIFSGTAVSLISVLGKQIAISMHNALLYEELREKEKNLIRSLDEKEGLLLELDIRKKQHVLRIIEAEEREKEYLARELHDQTGQQIAALKMLLQNLSTTESEKLYRLQKLADDISGDLRDIAHRVMPRALGHLGLVAAVEDLVRTSFDYSRTRAGFEFEGDRKVRLPQALERTLYRIAQELITNVVRHSGADAVTVLLAIDDRQLQLTVEDNGRGILNTDGGIGLSNIRTRLELFKGTFTLQAAEPAGTCATILIPLT